MLVVGKRRRKKKQEKKKEEREKKRKGRTIYETSRARLQGFRRREGERPTFSTIERTSDRRLSGLSFD